MSDDGTTFIVEGKNLRHYGILRKSGRYPWGSGGNAEARSRTFLDMVASMKKEGMTDTEIAKGLGLKSTTELRAAKTIAKNEKKQADIAMAQRLKDKGYSNVKIGERMGINESSVRSLLAPGSKDKSDILDSTTAMLKREVSSKGLIDVGAGVEVQLGMSKEKLATAVAMLKEEGYTINYLKVEQAGTGKNTSLKILAPPGMTYKEVFAERDNIRQIQEWSEDGGRTFLGIQTPKSLDSSRVAVRYAEQGGADADGVIYIRPGVKDVSLGGANYAQVRVAVDGTHYLKGMAMYKDDLPRGVDVMFNTNKSNTGNKLDAMKKLKDDPDNPFGSVISRQIFDKNDPKKLTSVMNLVNEEGDWDKWSKNLSSQVLSKQSPALAKNQLDLAYAKKRQDLDEIMTLTNPAVRKKLLESYAEDVDSSAIHLKAAAMPRQRTQVILPMNSLKETEVYAPNFKNGEQVVLIRYPHGGKFEIPELTVNNRNPIAKRALGQAADAIGINAKVAARLSGADFDGDTVLVIPNPPGSKNRIKSDPPLKGLMGFDPQSAYPKYDGMKEMSTREKGIQMGLVSNLITDMTIKGASSGELARAVRHSMVVIDAEKHKLNYKQSAIDNGIPQLMKKYQDRSGGGAATLISRATARQDVPARKEGFLIDKDTGKKIFRETGESYVDSKGRTIIKTQRSQKLRETDDANTLSSGLPMEKVYATHSNRLKALANTARKEAVNTKTIPYSPSAKKAYSKEVESLNSKLNTALRNAPRERQAQILQNAVVRQKLQDTPGMEKAEIKKLRYQALEEARTRTGARKELIQITDREWEAIQAGAVRQTRLSTILNNADLDRVKQLATPKTKLLMTGAKTRRAQALLASGATQAEVAEQLGVSLSTLKATLAEG